MSLESVIKTVKEYFVHEYFSRRYISDCTAVAVVSTPAYALMEKAVAGMSDKVSLDSRLWAAGLGYVGLNSLISLGRDYSRRMFGITHDDQKFFRKNHDPIYFGAAVVASNPLFYLAMGARDLKEIVVGTLAGAAVALAVGKPTGYVIDWFRDFFGIKKAERLPRFMKNAGPQKKKLLAAGLIAASAALTGAIYTVFTDNQEAIVSYETPSRKE
ncbi:L-alanine exporter AlaE [Candidatus Woesearchaeota archaeon]|nr:L-alanine exporter AlaE [Candidatus Woesearchaeota archaeon]